MTATMTATTTTFRVRPIETGDEYMTPLPLLGSASTAEDAIRLCEAEGYAVLRDGEGGLVELSMEARTSDGETVERHVWAVTVRPADETPEDVDTGDLVVCRSDTGDGGWSLHAPGSTDDAIATGEAPALVSGVGPITAADVRAARAALRR